MARSLAQGHGYGSPFADTGTSALMPPVYTYLLAAIFKIFGVYTTASIVAAAALNSVLSALTCIPVFFIARQCFGDRSALWSAWAWALSPYGIYFSADWLWSTCLVTLMLSALFLFALNLQTTTSLVKWCAFGLASAAAALTEPVVLSVLPFLAALSLYRQGRRAALPACIFAASLAAGMSPWIVRNYQIFHKFIPVRDGFGLELYLGNSADTTHWANRNLHPNHSDAELHEYETAGELAYMAHKQQQAVAFITAHPSLFLWMTLRRITYMWTGFWSFSRAYLINEPLDPPNVLVSTTLTILALLGLRRAFHLTPTIATRFALVMFFFPLAYYVSHPEAYYFRPLDPLISILAIHYLIKERPANA